MSVPALTVTAEEIGKVLLSGSGRRVTSAAPAPQAVHSNPAPNRTRMASRIVIPFV